MKLSDDKQEFFAETFTEFIDYFLGKGAPPHKLKEMFGKMVDSVEEDRKSLT
ncbi:hypothetical protein OAU44_00005 [bacterium]|nr:hypothetical protein [bacterium]